MIDRSAPQSSTAPSEAVLREALEEGDAVLGSVAPILGQLLANRDNSLFSDEIVARVKGMTSHIADQLLIHPAEAAGHDASPVLMEEQREKMASALMLNAPLLTHCHALVVEGILANQMARRNAIDPVVSPLFQALVASEDSATASTAMAALAAQARFMQQQRRMHLDLAELPGELFHQVLLTARDYLGEGDAAEGFGGTETALRASFDESSGRLGLFFRLLTGMGKGARAALSVSHAGTSIFLSAVALQSDQSREMATLSTHGRQMARLTLALRAAGLKSRMVTEQLLHLHPDLAIPHGVKLPRSDCAAAILSASPHHDQK